MKFAPALFFVLLTAISVCKSAVLPGSKKDSVVYTNNRNFVYQAKKAQYPIKIDGVIDEPDWQSAQRATDFFVVLPVDTGKAVQPSDVMLTYDDKALYMAIIFYDTIPGKRIAESYRRDFVFANNDNFLSFFDTFLDRTNGFSFGVSASGAMWDGLMSDGYKMNLSWDSKWEVKVKNYPDKWVSEMRVPFKSVRYPSGSQKWLVNFSRLDLKTNEKSAWAPVPRQFPTSSLAYTGVLNFDKPLPKPRLNFSIIPYVFGSYSENNTAANNESFKKDFGFDAKLGISTSMNLDLTYNPDFAQVEVDQQVMNIDRFELLFPEKRQFFLENNDLFSGYGYSTVTPFFSRRIGLDAPVLAGARLSGKIGSNLRIGFMSMTTEETTNYLSRNYTVLSVQKKVFARSNFGFIFVNKEYFGKPEEKQMFNRVFGFDYNLASSNNFWSGKLFYHRSFQPGNPDNQYAEGVTMLYSRRNFQLRLSQTSVGENYLAETGYVRRSGYNFWGPELTYLFVPNKRVVSHGIFFTGDNYLDPDYRKLDYEYKFGYKFEFRDRSLLNTGISNQYVKLTDDFDPTHVSGYKLLKGTEYKWNYFYADFTSDNRKMFNYSISAGKGGYFNSDMNYFQGKLGYRYQPYANFVLNVTYTDLNMPEPFNRHKFWLIGPKLDLTFTDKLFLTTFVQYNEQNDNMNINMRLQWRYKPVSDFFLVYTDNYLPGSWNSKNRAVVLKLTYWLN